MKKDKIIQILLRPGRLEREDDGTLYEDSDCKNSWIEDKMYGLSESGGLYVLDDKYNWEGITSSPEAVD